MTEYFYGRLLIGGPLPRRAKALDEFLRRLAEAGPARLSQPRLADFFSADLGLFEIQNERAPWGAFAPLETFCKKAGLPFDRFSDGYGDCAAEHVYVRPGRNVVWHYASPNGDDLVPRRAIREILARPHKSAAALRQALRQAIKPDVSDLPRLTAADVARAERTLAKQVGR